MRTLIALLLGLGCLPCGCTIVQVTSSNGDVRIERHAGFVHIGLDPDQSPVTADIRSAGFFTSPLGASLGFASARVTALPSSCHLVLFGDLPTGAHPEVVAAARTCVIPTRQQGETR